MGVPCGLLAYIAAAPRCPPFAALVAPSGRTAKAVGQARGPFLLPPSFALPSPRTAPYGGGAPR
eukprot:11963850-Alexandrium_andersonii.AAC.1